MISSLDVAFADVSARSLGWALDLSSRPALATMLVGRGQPQVELRLLGASHQVLVHADGKQLCSETVACDLPGSQPLPDSSRAGRYEFRSDVQLLDPVAFVATVERIAASLEDREDALLGHFPGVPHAMTALSVDFLAPQQMAWRSWHGYPQTGELVSTRTRLTYPEVTR